MDSVNNRFARSRRRCSTNARGVIPVDVLNARAKWYGLSAGARRQIDELNGAREIGLDEQLHTTQGRRRQTAAQMRPARRR